MSELGANPPWHIMLFNAAGTHGGVSETSRLDDLDDEEIKAVEEFYKDRKDLKTFKTADELIRWLNE